MKDLNEPSPFGSQVISVTWPILICLLGTFQILRAGQPVSVRSGGKTETFISYLALRHNRAVRRDALLATLWPESEPTLAAQALNSLVYSVHKLLGDAADGAAPVLYEEGSYSLNLAGGVGVDTACFDALAREAQQQMLEGDRVAAAASYSTAVELYRGDLSAGTDIHAVVERERLRALYLTMLAGLADQAYREREYAVCLDHALRLLASDPCREDAHRLVMRCHVRLGERAQALRQYRLCEEILRVEFDAAPEPTTMALFQQVRLDPASI